MKKTLQYSFSLSLLSLPIYSSATADSAEDLDSGDYTWSRSVQSCRTFKLLNYPSSEVHQSPPSRQHSFLPDITRSSCMQGMFQSAHVAADQSGTIGTRRRVVSVNAPAAQHKNGRMSTDQTIFAGHQWVYGCSGMTVQTFVVVLYDVIMT